VEEECDEDERGNLRYSARGIFYHVANRIINASTSRQNRGILRTVVMLYCSCWHTENRGYSGGQRVQQRMVSLLKNLAGVHLAAPHAGAEIVLDETVVRVDFSFILSVVRWLDLVRARRRNVAAVLSGHWT
jgi:ABC-type hemin transport system ATPase subunit